MKYTGYFTKEATKALRSSKRIVCQLTDDGIYVTNGQIMFCMSGYDYDAIVRPVTLCDPGNWNIEGGKKAELTLEVKKIMDIALREAKEGSTLEATPVFTRGSDKVILCGYYSKKDDFAAFYDSRYVMSFEFGAEIDAKSPIKPAVVHFGDIVVGVVCPCKVNDSMSRTVKEWFRIENQLNGDIA